MGERHNGIVEVTGSSPVRSTKRTIKMIVLFHNMFFEYILQSLISSRYYVGHTDEIARRVQEHNTGMAKYTRRDKPWKLVYVENYTTRSAAMKRELEIKRKKSKKYIEKLIESGERPDTPEV
jgi:putative endonuclease